MPTGASRTSSCLLACTGSLPRPNSTLPLSAPVSSSGGTGRRCTASADCRPPASPGASLLVSVPTTTTAATRMTTAATAATTAPRRRCGPCCGSGRCCPASSSRTHGGVGASGGSAAAGGSAGASSASTSSCARRSSLPGSTPSSATSVCLAFRYAARASARRPSACRVYTRRCQVGSRSGSSTVSACSSAAASSCLSASTSASASVYLAVHHSSARRARSAPATWSASTGYGSPTRRRAPRAACRPRGWGRRR